MCRKIAITVGAVLLGLVIVTYTSLPSLVQVKWHDGMAWFERQVPIETQIKQLKMQVDKIDNEIKGNIDKLAKMEVETKNLEQSVVVLREDQAKRKIDIAAQAKALETKSERVARRDLQSMTSKLDLENTKYDVKAAKLKGLEGLLAAKRETLEAAHRKIGEMRDQRDQLYVSIQKLETRKELVDIKTQNCQIQVSDGTLNECNALLKKINDRLTEEEFKADDYQKYGYGEKTSTPEKDAKSVQDVLEKAKTILKDDEQ